MEETKTQINHESADSYFIRDEKHSYAQFFINGSGDLVMNSDWGYFTHSWRSFGNDFKDFIAHMDVEYMIGKFEINVRMFYSKNGIPQRKHKEPHLIALIKIFQDILKIELGQKPKP